MAKRISSQRLQAAVDAERQRLFDILDKDPAAAVEEARQLRPREDLRDSSVQHIRGMVLIDAGGEMNDAAIVREGVDIFRHPSLAKVPDASYNRANGLAHLARLQGIGKASRLHTAEQRQEARTLFREAADQSKHPPIRSSSLNNLANELKDSYRWIEAYDTYAAAISADPANAIALSGITALLRWRLRKKSAEDGPIQRTAVRYLLRARANLTAAHMYAGQGGVTRIEELLKEFQLDDAAVPLEEPPPVSGYTNFVRGHRLALCVDVESVGAEAGRWDHLGIGSVSQPIESAMKTPLIFSTWNVLKADFLAARWLAYTALEAAPVETGAYSDTLDYACYGTKQSLLILAQKAAVDVLDKVAAAASAYLELGGDPRSVYFDTCWHEHEKGKNRKLATPLKWLKPVEDEILAGNAPLFALTELAHDYYGGFLRPKKWARNAGTHRFVVLHELWVDGRATSSKILDRHKEDEFAQIAIESLQVARAALFYLKEVVSARERRLSRTRKGLATELLLPSHHYIRGED